MTRMPPISGVHAQAVAIPFIPTNNQELSDAITRHAGHINAAHEKVRVAKSLPAFPLIDEAFRSGEISYSKVRAMTHCATPDNDAHLLQVAQHGTAQHVEKLVRKYTWAKRLDEPQQDKVQYETREFSWYHDDDGMEIFKGRLPAAEGAAFLQAMEVMLQAVERTDNAVESASAAAASLAPCSTKTFPQKRVCGSGSGEKVMRVSEGLQPEAKTEDVSAETFFDEIEPPTYTQMQRRAEFNRNRRLSLSVVRGDREAPYGLPCFFIKKFVQIA